MTERKLEEKEEGTSGPDDEISLFDLVLVLARHKRWVIGTPIVFGLVAMLVSLIITPVFTSKVVLMPPQQQSSGALAMLGDMAGLAGLSGGGAKSPGDLYASFLESRPVQDAMIDRFGLLARYKAEYRIHARKTLDNITAVKVDKKSGLISIEVNDPEPAFAAKMAMAYVEELQKVTDTLAISEAARRRLFFERQVNLAKDNLSNAEGLMRSTQERTKLIMPQGQIQAIFASIAQLRGAISVKEVEINAIKTFATAQNPDLKRAQQELAALKDQLNKRQQDHPTEAGDFLVPSSRIPASGMDFARAARSVKYYETVFELLAKQFELAKIDEAKEATIIQVVEVAVPAELKSKPKRALITILAALAGLMLGILAAFIREAWLKAVADPEFAPRLDEFRSMLRWRMK